MYGNKLKYVNIQHGNTVQQQLSGNNDEWQHKCWNYITSVSIKS